MPRPHYASSAFWSKPSDLPENIFPLTPNNLPDQQDADPHGNLLFFSPNHGWLVASFEEVQEAIQENKCTHWTYTPPTPSHALNRSS